MNKNKPALRRGQGVVWSSHPLKLEGAILRESKYAGFYEIELFDPPPGQSKRLRLTKHALTVGSDWSRYVIYTCDSGTDVLCGHHNSCGSYIRHEQAQRAHKYCDTLCVEHGLRGCSVCKGKTGRCLRPNAD